MKLILHYLLLGLLPIAFAAGEESPPVGISYHLDSANGNDANDGTSPEKPWKSLAAVNGRTFKPGDSILFRAGCMWTGQLRPKGSGAQDHPVRIGSYDEGPLPKITQGNLAGTVIEFENQEFWEVCGLEIDGGTPKPDKRVGGVRFLATDAGRMLRHVVVRDCLIRNIQGTVKDYESCAVWVGVPGWDSHHGLTTGFDWVLIENNRIFRANRCAILVWTPSAPAGQDPNHRMFQDGLLPSKHVFVRHNEIEDVGGDAILVLGSEKPLVESNTVRRSCIQAGDAAIPVVVGYNPNAAAVWLHSCLDGVMQFNRVYDSAKLPNNGDGMAFDFDFNCKGCVLQYNHSRNNAGGFLLIMISARDNTARYNISEDDRDHLLYLTGSLGENNLVYNNTFHLRQGNAYIIPRARITNNIFLVAGKASLEERDVGGGVFLNNCYAGHWIRLPEDAGKLAEDPRLENPGSRGDPASVLRGYSLRPASACRGRGVAMPNHGDRDIVGNPLPATGPPDIGAVQSSAKH